MMVQPGCVTSLHFSVDGKAQERFRAEISWSRDFLVARFVGNLGEGAALRLLRIIRQFHRSVKFSSQHTLPYVDCGSHISASLSSAVFCLLTPAASALS
jgi:hypothetical protein